MVKMTSMNLILHKKSTQFQSNIPDEFIIH